MTWSTSVKIEPNETFNGIDIEKVEEKYRADALLTLDAVEGLDTFDPTKERTVHLSGYRSATTNQVQVAVTGTATPPAGTGG